MTKAVIMGVYSQKFKLGLVDQLLLWYLSRSSVQFAQAPNTKTEPQMIIAVSIMIITMEENLHTSISFMHTSVYISSHSSSIFSTRSAHFLYNFAHTLIAGILSQLRNIILEYKFDYLTHRVRPEEWYRRSTARRRRRWGTGHAVGHH